MIESLPPLLAVALLFPVWRRHRAALFFVLLLLSECFIIRVGFGTARVYHFVALVAAVLSARSLPRLLASRTFVLLILFVVVNGAAAIASDDPARAVSSFGTVAANIAIALTTAILLLSGRVPIPVLRRTVIVGTTIAVGWAMIQFTGQRLAGTVLALAESQISQIEAGFAPAFRTEANTFAKCLAYPFMLFLPEFVEEGGRGGVRRAYVAFAIGMVLNFTRSALFGMSLTGVFVAVDYALRRKASLLIKKGSYLVVSAVALVALALSGVLPISDYAVYKISYLFDLEELIAGGSGSYRLEGAANVVRDTFSSTKKTLIGNGWGQTRVDVRGIEVQAGAGDLMTIWSYCGILGALLYIAIMLSAILDAKKAASKHPSQSVRLFARGTIYATIALVAIGQLAGAIASPEYWMLLGIAITLGVTSAEAGSGRTVATPGERRRPSPGSWETSASSFSRRAAPGGAHGQGG